MICTCGWFSHPLVQLENSNFFNSIQIQILEDRGSVFELCVPEVSMIMKNLKTSLDHRKIFFLSLLSMNRPNVHKKKWSSWENFHQRPGMNANMSKGRETVCVIVVSHYLYPTCRNPFMFHRLLARLSISRQKIFKNNKWRQKKTLFVYLWLAEWIIEWTFCGLWKGALVGRKCAHKRLGS